MKISSYVSLSALCLLTVSSCTQFNTPDPDITPPSIILNGQSTIKVDVFDEYVESGVYSTFDEQGAVTVEIEGEVDTQKVGEYEINYIATDLAGNQTIKIRIVQVVDQQIPVITLNGDKNVTHSFGDEYIDPSALVSDNYDIDLAVSVLGQINENQLGLNTLTYQAQDSSGNYADELVRIVAVIDDVAPVITLNGDQNVILERGDNYIESGAVVTDNYDQVLNVVIAGEVNSNQKGTYLISFNAVDSFNNQALTVTKVVEVVDTTAPELILNGDSEVFIDLFADYVERGITIENEIDGDYEITISGEVINQIVGEYLITYSVTDGSSNQSSISRVVTVQDNIKPIIHDLLPETQILEYSEIYDHSSITVTDNYDVGIPLIISGEVNTSVIGRYQITYDAIDSSGNSATSYSKLLTVVDTQEPEMIVSGPEILELYTTDNFIEPEATAIDGYDGVVDVISYNNVDITQVGNYLINYIAQDSSGNRTQTNKSVIVQLDEYPEISLNGDSVLIHVRGTPYSELGATTLDDRVGMSDIQISGNLDLNTVGQYDVTYSVEDSANQTSITSREVYIVDRPFITTWQVGRLGGIDDYQIEIPITSLYSDKYDYIIDWGDGSVDFDQTGSTSHIYNAPGNYQIKIYGDFARFRLANDDREKILSVDQWGDIKWQSMSGSFYNAVNMNVLAIDAPNLINAISLNQMFYNADSFNADISHWDVSTIVLFSNMFEDTDIFNQDLSSWDVSAANDMSYMFFGAKAFNQDISGWNVWLVNNMSAMFSDTQSFNQNLTGWNVSRVRDMSHMFSGAEKFNGEMFNWNVENVTNMSQMFKNASEFNQDISSWTLLKVEIMEGMFSRAVSFNQPLDSWNVGSVLTMSDMFEGAEKFNQPLNNWNVENVSNMNLMFQSATDFNQDLHNWDVSSVVEMTQMFQYAEDFNGNVTSWNIESAETLHGVFYGTSNFNQDIGNWNISSVTDLSTMFLQASAFDQDLSGWNYSNVENFTAFIAFTEFSSENYESLLIALDNQSTLTDVSFESTLNLARPGTAGDMARTNLINNKNWSFNDIGSYYSVPEITLNDGANINVFQFSNFVDPGAIATDFYDGVLTYDISGNVDTQVLGEYELTYSSTNSQNRTTTVIRTVNVIPDLPPQIAFDEQVVSELLQGANVDSILVTALDDKDGELNLEIIGEIDIHTPGFYELTFIATDSSNQTTQVTRTVEVIIAEFITTWTLVEDINQPSSLAVRIYTNQEDYSGEYNFHVSWGDGQSEQSLTNDITHTYAQSGDYQITITGLYPHIYFSEDEDDLNSSRLITVDKWGQNKWKSLSKMFRGSNSMNFDTLDSPDLTFTTDMSEMFLDAEAFNSDIGHWDVSDVTDMSYMFQRSRMFNQDISNWNVSNVEDMSWMFAEADIFDQDIGQWDVSNVEYMIGALSSTKEFNQDIGNWDVTSVKSMSTMFAGSGAFDQDISRWDVSNVIDLQQMFISSVFNQDINDWDVSSVTSLFAMFAQAKNFNQPIDEWNVSQVGEMALMFAASPFDQDISDWRFRYYVDMADMFVAAKLSTENYDKLLISLSNQAMSNGVYFNGGESQYTPESQASIARDNLINTLGWNLVDGGPVQIID